MCAQIENQAYPVNVEALNTVFSPYGFVQKIAIFEKNGQSQVWSSNVLQACMLVLACMYLFTPGATIQSGFVQLCAHEMKRTVCIAIFVHSWCALLL